LFSSLVLASHSRLVHLDCRFHPPLSSRFRTDLSRLKRRGIITPGRVEESHGKRERVKNSHTSASANELCRSTPHASNHSPFCCSFFSTHSFFFSQPHSLALKFMIWRPQWLETASLSLPLKSAFPFFLLFSLALSTSILFTLPLNYSHLILLKWYLFG